MRELCIAIPTGALLPGSCQILRDASIADIEPESFGDALSIHSNGVRIVTIRPTDVPTYVGMGACDVGFVGKDVLWESHHDVYELVDLGFGMCRFVVAAPAGSPIAEGQWPLGFRIGTKYPIATQKYLDSRGITPDLLKLHGSVELAPLTGLVDAITDLVVTGKTMAANNLVEVVEVGRSTARLIVNQAACKTRSKEISELAASLRLVAQAS